MTTTIRALAGEACRRGLPLTVLASVSNCSSDDTINLRNFEPVGEFGLPEYESQKLAFPPFLDMLEYLEKQRFSELIVSTPGPVGLTALLAANLLGLRTTGIYHTDFPRYVRQLSDDESMEGLAWKYMTWFYDQMDTIIVPSESYRNILVDRGFNSRKLAVIGRGVDTQRFTPAKGDESLWSRGEKRRPFTFVYAGRISAEKNVQMLLTSFEQFQKQQADAQLIVVGDGPLLQSLQSRFESDRVRFTGFLDGDDLATAYASSDAFVFPSTTDTFGNVVLEAMASGLPAIVSDRGGPAETVRRHGGGMVVDTESPRKLAEAMNALVTNVGNLEKYRIAAMQTAREASWGAVFDEFWNVRGDAIHPTPFSSSSNARDNIKTPKYLKV